MRTISGSGSFSVAVSEVFERPPKNGISAQVPRGFGPRGFIDSMWTAIASPGSAPSMMIGPFCGFTKGIFSTFEGRSCSVFTAPPNASRVSTTMRSPGFTCSTGCEYGPIVKW